MSALKVLWFAYDGIPAFTFVKQIDTCRNLLLKVKDNAPRVFGLSAPLG